MLILALVLFTVAVAACAPSASHPRATVSTPNSTSPSAADWPSTVPSLVRERVERVEAEIARSGSLSPDAAASLSDNFLQANTRGELRLEFHGSTSVGDPQADDLRALGATVITVASQPAALVEVWIPYDRVRVAAQLAWVVAVRPSEQEPPDSGG